MAHKRPCSSNHSWTSTLPLKRSLRQTLFLQNLASRDLIAETDLFATLKPLPSSRMYTTLPHLTQRLCTFYAGQCDFLFLMDAVASSVEQLSGKKVGLDPHPPIFSRHPRSLIFLISNAKFTHICIFIIFYACMYFRYFFASLAYFVLFILGSLNFQNV